MNPKPLTPVFVYGTLKKGFPLHRQIKDRPFLGEAELKGFTMVNLGFCPGIVRDEKAGTIKGEIYDIDPITLARLDAIEGAYDRQLHVTTDGRWVSVYVYPAKVGPIVKDGVWK